MFQYVSENVTCQKLHASNKQPPEGYQPA